MNCWREQLRNVRWMVNGSPPRKYHGYKGVPTLSKIRRIVVARQLQQRKALIRAGQWAIFFAANSLALRVGGSSAFWFFLVTNVVLVLHDLWRWHRSWVLAERVRRMWQMVVGMAPLEQKIFLDDLAERFRRNPPL